MRVNGKHYRSIWEKANSIGVIQIIDQRYLPFEFIIEDIDSCKKAAIAIKEMQVRGAPLIGIMAAYGLYLAALHTSEGENIRDSISDGVDLLSKSRPTAVNLNNAIEKTMEAISGCTNKEEVINAALNVSRLMIDEDLSNNKRIGELGYRIIKDIAEKKEGGIVNIMTHCNAGWLATVDYGTATAPIYFANRNGIKIHVWVSETRPRNQGAKLTSWELYNEGIPHTVVVDNASGYLMHQGFVDVVLVGTDRTLLTGDVVNKIGTYLKALAASDNNIPFYVAVPSSSIDRENRDGLSSVPIEQRSPDEVKYIEGEVDGKLNRALVANWESSALNVAFDITPGRLITGLITERGICKAERDSILKLFSEMR